MVGESYLNKAVTKDTHTTFLVIHHGFSFLTWLKGDLRI